MNCVLRVWATEMGLEIRSEGLFRNGERVFFGETDDENRAFLQGYEQQLPEEKRKEINERVNRVAARRLAHDRMWGTYVYLATAEQFWETAKLAIEYELEFPEHVHPLEMHVTYGLYMGNQFHVLLLVVTDEPSPARTVMLKALQEHFGKKDVIRLDAKGEIDLENLLWLWQWRNEPKLKPSYTPEILAKLRDMVNAAMEPAGFRLDENGEPQPDLQAMKNDFFRNDFAKIKYGCQETECY